MLINRFTNFNFSIFIKFLIESYSLNDLQQNSKDNVNGVFFITYLTLDQLTLWHGIDGIHENRDKKKSSFYIDFYSMSMTSPGGHRNARKYRNRLNTKKAKNEMANNN